MRFDLDEQLPAATDAELLEALKAAKVDEWAAVTGLRGAAAALRSATGRPDAAPIAFVLCDARNKAEAGDARVRRALAAYEAAASVYEGVRVALAELRQRAEAAG